MGTIYMIISKVNNKIYVGACDRPFEERKKQHLGGLKCNTHVNRKLQKDFNKYGEYNFEFNTLKSVKSDELNHYENYFIMLFKSNLEKFGYNRTNFRKRLKLNNIKHYLKKLGKDEKWLCPKIGTDFTTAYRYTSNTSQPSLVNLIKIAKILNVKTSDLINDDCEFQHKS